MTKGEYTVVNLLAHLGVAIGQIRGSGQKSDLVEDLFYAVLEDLSEGRVE